MEAHSPRNACSMVDLERLHGVVGKYTRGMLQAQQGSAGSDEDPVSMALTVVSQLLRRLDVGSGRVGRLQVSSESLVDRSKSIKSNLMALVEAHGGGDVEGVDSYHACYGGTSVLLCCLDWLQGAAWDGRYAVMVASDVSDAPAQFRFMSGAAAVAVVLGPEAPVRVEPA